MSDPLLVHLDAEIERLEALGTPAGAPLVAGFRTTTAARSDAAVARWQEPIERERHRLRRSGEPLSGGSGTVSTVADVTKRASSPRSQATLLYNLTRSFHAARTLEMGTGVGISGAYLAAALADNGGGHLCSLEGHPDRADAARELWQRLGFDNAEVIVGRFERTLEQALAGEPFDIAFIDGNHEGTATRTYVDLIRASSRPGALLILDDIAWSDGMVAAWRLIATDLSDSVTSDLGRLGLIVLGPKDAGLT